MGFQKGYESSWSPRGFTLRNERTGEDMKRGLGLIPLVALSIFAISPWTCFHSILAFNSAL